MVRHGCGAFSLPIVRRGWRLALAMLALIAAPAAHAGDDLHDGTAMWHRGHDDLRAHRDRPQAADAIPPWRQDPFPSTYRPAAAPALLIRHATVLDGAGRRIDDGDVLLAGGKVVAIGHALANPGGVREIDAAGRWVTPGTIDIHSHDGTYVLPLTAIDRDSSDVSELADPDAADIWIETAINPQDIAFARARENGVTTLQVLPGSSPIFGGRSVVLHPIAATTVAAMKVPDAWQGFKMACGENPKSEDAEAHRGPTSREGEIAFIRNAFLDAQDEIADWQRWQDGHGPPPRRDLRREALAGILTGDIHVHMHCYRAEDMAVMLAVAREFGFTIAAFHHAAEAYKIPDLLKSAGTCAAVWGDWWGFKMEALDANRASAPLLDRDGVCVTMHSDSPVVGQHLNLEAAKAGAAARRLGIVIPPEEMIRWTTSTPARLLGLGTRTGTLAPGLAADVVVWSGNPFSVYTQADLVLIDGASVFDRSAPPQPPSDFAVGRATMMPQPGAPQ